MPATATLVMPQIHAALAHTLQHVDGFADDELGRALVELSRAQAMLDAVKARATHRWNGLGYWAFVGAKNCAAWLAKECHLEPRAARRQVRHAKHLATMPETWQALAAGLITSEHVARFVAIDTPRTAEALRRDERALVDVAKRASWSEFCRQIELWSHHVDVDGATPRTEKRQVHLSRTIDGCWALNGWLDPVSGAIVDQELHRLERQMFKSDWSAAKEALGRDPLPGELGRTPGQRRADAPVEMARRSHTAPAGGRAPRPLISIAVGLPALQRMCEIRGGAAIHPAEAAALLDEAVIERLVFSNEGRTLTASPQRTFTGALRRAVEIRDRECFHAYCAEPADRCEVDHVIPWAQGGVTELANAQLACPFHNRARVGGATRVAKRAARGPLTPSLRTRGT